ncbi:MAG: hypothetical protein BWY78_01035 [Alphaproteobacteria bacterium ADurb.Bin438]|nr:MAG: hypothetical protein BWY78_01035 [Alphaproteobacteria bacterium ADurb.Bin438]
MDIIINDLYYSCEEDDGKLSVKIAPEFKVIKRMAYKQGESFSYFVAVADKNGGIVSKQTFKITVDKIDEIGFSIIKDNKDVSVDLGSNNKDDYVIYIGLQLNEKQLKNNRSDKLWLN